jgi:hypothetical protein
VNKELVLAFAIAISAFGTAWKVQDWRYGAKETSNAKADTEIERIASADRSRRDTKVIDAQKAGARRAATIQRDATAVVSEYERLLNTSREAAAIAQLSHEACKGRISAYRDVFEHCAAEYQSVARTADGHANDAMTLDDAWPEK